tara:strand:+ start:360 stop:854 length:495 start_codon:yes stop_codon:yes gene_type:complete
MKEHFEINIENFSNEEKADVLYYNIFLAIVSELKLDKYFVDSNNNKQDEDIQHLVGMSFRMTLDNKTIRNVVVTRSPADIWAKLAIYYLVRENENIPMIILIDELIQEFRANKLTYNEEIVTEFYRTFKNYIVSKTYSSDEIKNIDINVDWKKIEDIFSKDDVV